MRKSSIPNKCYSFPPNANLNADILILGSMPGAESLRRQQYYAHPQNQFWRITGTIYGFDHKITYQKRLQALRAAKIALWDSVHNCIRPGSMDADIRNVEPNDFESFFKRHRYIRRIVFNGKTAEKLFYQYTRNMSLPQIEYFPAPSTSPAYASMSYDKKLEVWRSALSN